MSWAEIKKAVNSDLSTPLNEKIDGIDTSVKNRIEYINGVIPRGLIQRSWNASSPGGSVNSSGTTIESPTGGIIFSIQTYVGIKKYDYAWMRVSIDPTNTSNPSSTAEKVFVLGSQSAVSSDTTGASITSKIAFDQNAAFLSNESLTNQTVSINGGALTTNVPIRFSNRAVIEIRLYRHLANSGYAATANIIYAFNEGTNT